MLYFQFANWRKLYQFWICGSAATLMPETTVPTIGEVNALEAIRGLPFQVKDWPQVAAFPDWVQDVPKGHREVAAKAAAKLRQLTKGVTPLGRGLPRTHREAQQIEAVVDVLRSFSNIYQSHGAYWNYRSTSQRSPPRDRSVFRRYQGCTVKDLSGSCNRSHI